MTRYTRREMIGLGLTAYAATSAIGLLGVDSAEAAKPKINRDRERLNFNRDYRFTLGDPLGAESVTYDDNSWEETHLPHSFSLPYWGEAQFYAGYGWYRKSFDVIAAWQSKKLFLEFEAAFQDAEIYINGKLAGGHKGGYTGFTIDITPFVAPGSNILAVRLNNNWDAETAPRAGEHQFAAGLYRNVYLVVTDPVHVPYCGTTVTAPNLMGNTARLNMKTMVENATSTTRTVKVTHTVSSPTGAVVAKMTGSERVAAGATAQFDLTSDPITTPMLWHPDHPNLYTIATSVVSDAGTLDTVYDNYGFRWFNFDAEKGFFLNGEHYAIDGANVHQDHAGWGNAVSNAGIVRDVRMVKDAGFNFIRGSHYPHHPAFYEACDRLGILVWSEFCFWGIGGAHHEGFWNASAYPPDAAHQLPFEASCLQGLREMIEQHRNNPSVIAWSMCNEVFFSDTQVLPEAKALLSKMVALTHELDPSRRAGIGGCQRGNLDHLGDIAGYNGDGARLFSDPGIPNIVTEYGSVVADRPGEYGPHWTDGVENAPVWRSGRAVWCMYDHGSIAGHFGFMGLVDYFRLPKRSWYWYRNFLRNIPPPVWPVDGTPTKLQLELDKATIASDGTDDCKVIVTILDAAGNHISNSVPVVLSVEQGPGEFPTGSSIPFSPTSPIAIRDGQAAIEFRSYYAGDTLIRATSPGLLDATISLTTIGDVPYSPASAAKRSNRLRAPLSGEVSVQAASNQSMNRPTKASSEASLHPANLANDGDASTSWVASANDSQPWWQVDLEHFVAIKSVRLAFSDPNVYGYLLETSMDGRNWTSIAPQSSSLPDGTADNPDIAHGPVGRFFRVVIVDIAKGAIPGLREVEVDGVDAG